MRARLALCLALSATVLTAAQDAGDRRSDLEKPSTPVAVRQVHKFATCVALRFPTRAATLLALDYRAPEYRTAMNKLVQGQSSCVRGVLRFNPVLMAGGLAETLLERRDGAGISALKSAETSVAARDDIEFTSLCVVRQAPEAVVALLATEPTSEAEKTALNAITPSLPGCIRNGMQVRFNRQGLRAVLALAVWRIAQPRAGNS